MESKGVFFRFGILSDSPDTCILSKTTYELQICNAMVVKLCVSGFQIFVYVIAHNIGVTVSVVVLVVSSTLDSCT